MGKEHADHLINCLEEETYKLTEDWRLILWHLAPMGLQGMKIGYFDVRIYQETIVKI